MVNKPPGRRCSAGFTLIEILVALAVIAIAVAAVVAAVSGNVKNEAYIQDRTFAHWVAMNKVAELQTANVWPAPGTQQGESLLASQEWSWQIKISTTDDPDVLRVDVDAFADRDQKHSLASIVAYLSRPSGGSGAAAGVISP